MKVCTLCKQKLKLSCFYINKKTKLGFTARCKSCTQIKNKLWVTNNREKNNQRIYAWNKKNSEKVKQAFKTWRQKNLSFDASRQRLRKALKINRIPLWVDSEEFFLISEIYHLAKLRTKILGFPWHVDHIVPLKYKNASGLHCVDNLQVIPAVTNLKKRNLYIG